ncbi:MAG TPA: DoxX family protein [Chitinophagaceae bacterium]|jgi:putative oxidoreductase|nr:DoxX family protein [Chitinophagaceae bacterium]
MKKFNRFFETKKEYGAVFLRLVIGWRLIAGVAAYATGTKPISEVSGFFTQLNIPAPSISAWLSVYAQFICGILFIIGLWVRPAALTMIINFSIAIIAAHTGDPVERSFAAWALLATSLFLLFHGAGKLSFDQRFVKLNSRIK